MLIYKVLISGTGDWDRDVPGIYDFVPECFLSIVWNGLGNYNDSDDRRYKQYVLFVSMGGRG